MPITPTKSSLPEIDIEELSELGKRIIEMAQNPHPQHAWFQELNQLLERLHGIQLRLKDHERNQCLPKR